MNEFQIDVRSTIDHIILSVSHFTPEALISLFFILSIFVSLFVESRWKGATFFTFIAGFVAVLTSLIFQQPVDETFFFGMLTIDSLSISARLIIAGTMIPVGILLHQFFKGRADDKRMSDVYVVLLGTALGLHLLTMTTHWLMVFISIEFVSIGSYILTGYFSVDKQQTEASMKYVLFGSVCAAVMLYGLSLMYGLTGTLDFASLQQLQGLINAPKVLTVISILFIFVGIGFKLGFVPFHVWTPDVYQGAPTPVTAFLTTVPKIAAVIVFSRLLESWTSNRFYFGEVTLYFLQFVAIVSMLVGNLIALRQEDIKRMMAYSSIGHSGFLMMAAFSVLHGQQEVLLFFLLTYAVVNIGVFALIGIFERKLNSTQIPSYTGLGQSYPLLFGCFTFLAISLVGLPPSAGFVGKLMVFTSIFDIYQETQMQGYLLMLIVGVLTSVISLFYYFKIPLYAFLRSGQNKNLSAVANSTHILVIIVVIFTLTILLLGLFPQIVLARL